MCFILHWNSAKMKTLKHWKQQTTLKKRVVCVFLPKKACRNVSALWWSHRCQPRSCCIWSRRRRYHCEQQQQQPYPVLRCVICARRGSRDQSTYAIFLKNDTNPRIGCQEFPIPSSSRLQWLCQCAEWDLAEIFIFLCFGRCHKFGCFSNTVLFFFYAMGYDI